MALVGFGDRLTRARKEAGHKNPLRASLECDIAETSLREYENGDKWPGAEALKSLCEAFDVSADVLLGIKRKAACGLVRCPR